MKFGKSTGLDGLTVECYRSLKEDLIPHMQELFRYCLEQGKIPTTWKEARLVAIPKKERDKVP